MTRPDDGPVRGALYALIPALAGWAGLIVLAIIVGKWVAS